jgi:O-antigen/teichoic acid export membrane protein
VFGSIVLVVITFLGATLLQTPLADLLDSDVELENALLVGVSGYLSCHVLRGGFAGRGEWGRYSCNLAVDGLVRLLGSIALVVAGSHEPSDFGWLLGISPWVAALTTVHWRRAKVSAPAGPAEPMVQAVGLLILSSMVSQLLINAGPLVVKFFATGSQTARAGAFLAALVVMRIPFFLFSAVQATLLQHLASARAANDRSGFLKTVLTIGEATVVMSVLATTTAVVVGPAPLLDIFGFSTGLVRRDLLALGTATGLFLVCVIVVQALIALAHHQDVLVGWGIGMLGLIIGSSLVSDPVDRASLGFLLAGSFSLVAFSLFMRWRLRLWRIREAADGDAC